MKNPGTTPISPPPKQKKKKTEAGSLRTDPHATHVNWQVQLSSTLERIPLRNAFGLFAGPGLVRAGNMMPTKALLCPGSSSTSCYQLLGFNLRVRPVSICFSTHPNPFVAIARRWRQQSDLGLDQATELTMPKSVAPCYVAGLQMSNICLIELANCVPFT